MIGCWWSGCERSHRRAVTWSLIALCRWLQCERSHRQAVTWSLIALCRWLQCERSHRRAVTWSLIVLCRWLQCERSHMKVIIAGNLVLYRIGLCPAKGMTNPVWATGDVVIARFWVFCMKFTVVCLAGHARELQPLVLSLDAIMVLCILCSCKLILVTLFCRLLSLCGFWIIYVLKYKWNCLRIEILKFCHCFAFGSNLSSSTWLFLWNRVEIARYKIFHHASI